MDNPVTLLAIFFKRRLGWDWCRQLVIERCIDLPILCRATLGTFRKIITFQTSWRAYGHDMTFSSNDWGAPDNRIRAAPTKSMLGGWSRQALHENSAPVRLDITVTVIAFAKHAGPALTAEYLAPCTARMVFTHEANAEADRTFRIDHIDPATNIRIVTMSPAKDTAIPRSTRKSSEETLFVVHVGPREISAAFALAFPGISRPSYCKTTAAVSGNPKAAPLFNRFWLKSS